MPARTRTSPTRPAVTDPLLDHDPLGHDPLGYDPAEDEAAAETVEGESWETEPAGWDRQQPAGSRVGQTVRIVAAVALTPVTVASQMLPRSRPVVYYAGLAAAAVAGVIDWPIATVAAAAVWAVRQPATPPAPSAAT